ncbi:MAG: PQQ-like beta-propeller repeat protein [Bryobacterales bacterium]|nr:PQQ-like beta-propeller repeat protein [Bryobacterales bacterium]
MRFVFVLLGSWAVAGGQDWPQLLGPGRNGAYGGTWNGKGSFSRVWKRDAGAGFAGAAVASGRVLLFQRVGGEEVLESIEPGTGKTQWKFAYPAGYRDDFGFSEGPRAVPAVDGEFVYVYGAEGTLSCVRLGTGQRVWQVDAKKEFGIRKEFFGAACSPAVSGDRLLMNIGGANGAGVVAIDKKTGKTLWKALNDEAGYSSPVVATIGGQMRAIFFTREGLVDADPSSGRVRWQFKWRARQAASVNAAVPLVAGDEIFASASYGTGAVLLKVEGDKAKPVWSGDDSLSNHYATSVVKDGYLYGFHGRQEFGQALRCVEWKTGKVKWSVDGFGAGTVTLAGDHLFVLREDGELQIAPASPKGYKAVKKVKVAEEQVRPYPAFSNGRMYVRTEHTLSAWRID